jgi:putative transposase
MTAPRQVFRGASYLVTRRCMQRQFLLRACRVTNDIFLFALAHAAARHRVAVHAFCVLSNHFHLVVTDPHADLPRFMQDLDFLVAKAVNSSLGRWESFWAPDTYSAVRLLSPSDIVDKSAYTLANPVQAGLVGSGDSWPGLWSAPSQIGGDAIDMKRPAHFFDPKGVLPAQVTIRLTVPPGFDSAEGFRERLLRELQAREEAARKRWRARGGFLGVARVLARSRCPVPSRASPVAD